MPEEPEIVPVDEVKRLAGMAMDHNIDIMSALAEYDKRIEGSMTAQKVGQYFTMRYATGMNELHSSKVEVFGASSTNSRRTEFVKAE